MDTLKVERERGITVKAQTASMVYRGAYLLNLIDTPGHVDFSYEVLRSLGACQGALLLVDASQGVEAQTLSTFAAARDAGLAIVPIVTKIDLPNAQPDETILSMATTFDLDPESVIATSSKTGEGIDAVLEAIVQRLEPPLCRRAPERSSFFPSAAVLPTPAAPTAAAIGAGAAMEGAGASSDAAATAAVQLRCRLVDSWFDTIRGVICLVQVVDGCLAENARITTSMLLRGGATSAGCGVGGADSFLGAVPRGSVVVGAAGNIDSGGGGSDSGSGDESGVAPLSLGSGAETFSVQEVGVLSPTPIRTKALQAGQVGYMIAGMRSTRQALVGDTVVSAADAAKPPPPLPPPPPSACAVFASVFPLDGGEFDLLRTAVERLALNDAALRWQREHSAALGSGLRVGFLGLLHLEVFHQRLVDEFDTSVLLTAPTVPYRIVMADGSANDVVTLADWPDTATASSQANKRQRFQVFEPMVEATVITPADCLGAMLQLLTDRRGEQLDVRYLDESRVLIRHAVPWAEVVTDFHDAAKNASSGYASFDFRPAPPRPADLVKVDIALNGENVDALSFVCHRDKAERQGRALAQKLKESIDRQQFEVVIQARLGLKPFARERIAPYRKDVLTKGGKTVGGGDITRKKKLLEKQKAGKKRAKTIGKVELSQEAFWSVLSRT